MAKKRKPRKGKSKAQRARDARVKVLAAPLDLLKYPEGHSGKITPEHIKNFLQYLAEGHSPTHAARCISFSREHMYQLRRDNEKFAAAWAEALEMGTNALEDLAIARARAYSDNLLMFLLKSRDAKFQGVPRGGSLTFPPGEGGKGGPKATFTFDFGSGVTPHDDE